MKSWKDISGWFDQPNYDAFKGLTLPDKATILEIGTYCGRSTHALREIFPAASITSCDPNDDSERVSGEYTFIHSRGQDLEWGNPIDLLFIDSIHTFDDTKENFEKYEPFVKPGGYIVFHDYSFPHAEVEGVKRFVDQLGGCEISTEGEFGIAIWRKPSE